LLEWRQYLAIVGTTWVDNAAEEPDNRRSYILASRAELGDLEAGDGGIQGVALREWRQREEVLDGILKPPKFTNWIDSAGNLVAEESWGNSRSATRDDGHLIREDSETVDAGNCVEVAFLEVRFVVVVVIMAVSGTCTVAVRWWRVVIVMRLAELWPGNRDGRTPYRRN